MRTPTEGVPGCPLCSSLNMICTLHCIASTPAQSIDEKARYVERMGNEIQRQIKEATDERTTKSETPRTDAYFGMYDDWMAYSKKYPNMPPEQAEKCPLDKSPEEFCADLERDLVARGQEKMRWANTASSLQGEINAMVKERDVAETALRRELNEATERLAAAQARLQREAKVSAILEAAKWFAKNRLDGDAHGVLMARATAIEAGESDE